jgi:SAM-dependent methyltransferase
VHPVDLCTHNWLIKRAHNQIAASLIKAISGRVLDLGCGTKPYGTELAARASLYVGLDWPSSLHASRAEVLADLRSSLPLVDESFDHAVCFEVLEHVPEPSLLLAEAFRVIRSGGTLVLSAPFQWWAHEQPWDYYRYTSHGLRYLLEKAGFADVRIQSTTGFWSMWILKLNYKTLHAVRGPRFLRICTRAAMLPLWWTGQTLAYLLDRAWPDDRETAGYFAIAVRP